MSNYYLYRCDSDRFDTVTPRPPSSHDDKLTFDGRSLKDRWRPMALSVRPGLERGNFFSFAGHIPVCDERAIRALGPLIESDAEVLSLDVDSEELPLLALNTRVLDCLDRNRAEIEDLGHGMIYVERYAFRHEVLGPTAIFRIPGLELSHCYVSEAFRHTVETHRLKGLILKPLPMA